MTEPNLFQPVDTTPLYNDGIGYVTLYDASHANESEEQRIWTVTTVSSLAYGNDEAKNPERLYEKLKELKHESLWEFIRSGDIQGLSTISSSMRNENMSAYYRSPFHTSNIACFRIKTPIFVARQFMRHRSFSYLEMSRRYTKDSKVPFEFWFPSEFEEPTKQSFRAKVLAEYKWNIKQGFHTQIASRFLPQTTYTTFYIMGEVEGLKNFFSLRCKKDAQDEIRELSMAMLSLLAKHQPELYQKVLP